jgi:prepilin-type N-terminal cleavage/methylation domain-containing protein
MIRRRAFSLLEMMVVVAIAGIMTAIAVGSLRGALENKKEVGAARSVAALISRARLLAIDTHSRVRVDADTATNALRLSSCPAVYGATLVCATGTNFGTMAQTDVLLNHGAFLGVRLTSAPTTPLIFDAKGLPEAIATYTYVVDHPGQPQAVQVVVSTAGEIRVQ